MKILISGELSYTPLGRHSISFILTLSEYRHIQIYLDVIVGEHADQLYGEYISKQNVFDAKNLAFNYKYDFAFYTHIIPNGYDFCQYNYLSFQKRNADIKGYYCVFDGTVPPLHWVPFINNEFDICLAPSRYIANCLKKYGVNICCFGLHCVVLNENYLQFQKRSSSDASNKFKFGFVGTIDFKKDVVLAIRAFVDEFSYCENVEFHAHLTGVPDSKMVDEINECLQYTDHRKSSVTISRGHIPQEDLENLFCSFDAYVFPQKITGYFTTICEALSIGIPVITSDIAPLKEILDYIDSENNIFWVEAKNISPAFHSFSHYMLLGASFESTQQQFQEKMRKVFESRDVINTEEKILRRKKAAFSLSYKALSKTWINLIRPKRICITDNFYHDIYNDTFFMTSELYQKYKRIYPRDGDLNLGIDLKKRIVASDDYWFLGTKENDLVEKFSKYHQELILSTLTSVRTSATPERELLITIKKIPKLLLLIFSRKNWLSSNLNKIKRRLIRMT